MTKAEDGKKGEEGNRQASHYRDRAHIDWLSIAYKQCIMKTIGRRYDSSIGKQNL
jgi:hypothetical protein